MKRILLTIALLSLGSQAMADPAAQSKWYVLAGTSYTWGDGYAPEGAGLGTRGGEDGFGWSLGSGWMVNDRLNFELGITSKNLNSDASTDVDQYGAEVSLLYFLNRDSRMAPYLVLGLGGVDNSSVPSQGFELFASGGFGFSSRLGDGSGAASLRVEARAIQEFSNRSLNDAVVNIALQIPVGAAN